MTSRWLRALLGTLGVLLACTGTAAAEESDSSHRVVVDRMLTADKGDIDAIRAGRALRVLTSHSKTGFFMSGGQARGFDYELALAYEEAFNQGSKKTSEQTTFVFVPLPFAELIDALVEGRGDVIAANMTVTPERAERVAFADPFLDQVHEVVVMHETTEGLDSVEDLSGRSAYVSRGSSYVTSLQALNESFAAAGKEPVEIVEGDPTLATEDILELVNANVLDFTIADSHIAGIWAGVLSNIVVREDLAVSEKGAIAWAVRKDNPGLLADVNAFVKENRKGSYLGNVLFKRYYEDTKWIANPISEQERKKLEVMVDLFDKYSGEFGFDWMAIAAQAYQESRLDHGVRSKAGAVGVMQLLPSTAADANVGIDNIENLENNIHAGIKYMDFLRSRYFSDQAIPADARVDFAWAAYNAGPGKIGKLREQAPDKGLDPNLWFDNVERLAPAETIRYVANINKYYVAYRLYFDKLEKRRAAIEEAGGEAE